MYIFDDVLDAFRATCIAQIGAQYELANPYILDENPDQYLYKGWGVLVGDATPSSLDEFKLMSTDQVFSVVLTINATKNDRLTSALKELYKMDTDTRNVLVQPEVSGINNAQVVHQNITAP